MELRKQTQYKITFLAFYQIIGGIIGLFYCVYSLFGLPLNLGSLLVIAIISIFYSFSIFCGYLVYNKKDNRSLRLSSINQLLQIISFSIAGFGFKYVSGVVLSIGVNYTEDFLFVSNFSISNFLLNFNNDKQVIELQINLVAVLVVVLIDKLKTEKV